MNANYNLLSYNLYHLLKNYAGPQHPLKQREILDILEDIYRMEPARGTLTKTLHEMEDAGCPICGLDGRKGIWLAPDFTDMEIKLLIGPLVMANYLSSKNLYKLLKKLEILDGGAEKSKRQPFKQNCYLRSQGDIFETLKIIQQAEEQQDQLLFTYCDLNENREFVPRKDKLHPNGQRTVSVYGFICVGNHYYMVAHEDEDYLRNFRIDKMTNLLITGKKARDISTISGYEKVKKLNVAEYVANMNYKMFPGDLMECEFRLHLPNPYLANYYINIMWDEFGDKAKNFTYVDKETIDFSVSIPKESAKIFVQQYCDIVEVIKPAELRNQVRDILKNALTKYK